ncbi:hypothetical protein [Streptomyces sp. ST2-7A]|uniref:hypothetical protein n=1 Tax=Streptomyces sp. ST2-7A TaxID=2907214 RepID=UPI001F35A7EF|nr:hypothetical protein [Streptomyces sp. ST2-7A]MCE7081043.1 hypothetical protein [Streptomyces sp. ST2-7A]
MKIRGERYDATVASHRDTLGLPAVEHSSIDSPSVARTRSVEFGPVTLWSDRGG